MEGLAAHRIDGVISPLSPLKAITRCVVHYYYFRDFSKVVMDFVALIVLFTKYSTVCSSSHL